MKKRRIASALLSGAMLMSMCCFGASAAERKTDVIIFGDLNLDSSVNLLDAITSQKYIINALSLDDIKAVDESLLDINKDGAINLLDAIALQKHLVASDVKDYIGSIAYKWYPAEIKTVEHKEQTEQKNVLRYVYTCADVCQACNTVFNSSNDTTFVNADGVNVDMKTHFLELEDHFSWRCQYDWYYVDDEGKLHDLNNDGKVENKQRSDWDGKYDNDIFFPEYNVNNGWHHGIEDYNSTHSDQFYETCTLYAYCNECNDKGEYILDSEGHLNEHYDGTRLELTTSVETIIYPESLADEKLYDDVYDKCEQVAENHKAYHMNIGFPDRYGEPNAGVVKIHKIYHTENVVKPAWTEKVVIREAGWYK